MPPEGKSLGAAIDEIVAALEAIDATARITAIKAACGHLNILMPIDAARASSVLETGVGSVGSAAITPTDIRSLKESKNPASAVEMACILAYYLQHHAPTEERKNEITAADVDKYFVQAGYPLPKRSDQLLVNARAAGYFDSAARGAYRLNAVGHNLVVHSLPRNAGAGAHAASPKKRAKHKPGTGRHKTNRPRARK